MAATSKVREQLAQQFLDALSQEQLPWSACWRQQRPLNAVTGKLYRGVNAFALSWIGEKRGYSDPRWCTYKQAEERGWQVRKGEKSVYVEYWAYYDRKQKKLLSWNDAKVLIAKDPDYADENLQLSCRTHCVFNAEQIDGIPELQLPKTDIGTLREHRDLLAQNMGFRYQEYGAEAFYSPASDTVVLPPEHTFEDPYSYIATFLHESGHATGHPSRLNRDQSGGFGSENYAREELRAEIAAAFTAQDIGLQLTDEQLATQTQRHAAYLQSWASILKDSPDELFKAIKDAEAISDYLLEKGEFESSRELATGQLGEVKYAVLAAADQPGLRLQFSGCGSVPEQIDPEKNPWMSFKNEITEVAFSWDIEGIGDNTLSGLGAVTKLTMPASIKPKGLDHLPKLQEVEFLRGTLQRRPSCELHSPKVIAQLHAQYPTMSFDQLKQIELAQRQGMSAAQIALVADPRYSADQMAVLRDCCRNGIAEDQLSMIADPAYSTLQMDVLRSCARSGMAVEQLAQIAHPEIPPTKMLDHYWEAKNNLEQPGNTMDEDFER